MDDLASIYTEEKLRKTWAQLRKELRTSNIRDCIDWIDWIVTIDQSLKIVSSNVISGKYRPKEPSRFRFAKSKGAYRELIMPNIIDCLVFRHISDHLYEQSKKDESENAYFARSKGKTPVGNSFELTESNYESFFVIWKTYHEYKTRTLLNDIYQVLVVTDISNFFDSISHQLLIEHLSPYIDSRKISGLILILLEALKPTLEHTVNPGIGIPVDDFDCSRQLAHIFLYEHDRRILQFTGKEHYVRWMDDQNLGAFDERHAREIIYNLTASLSSQRLTLNAGKTKFLQPEDVSKQFHLETNDALTLWEGKWKEKYKYTFEKNTKSVARRELIKIFKTSKHKDEGNWGKVLKRFLGHSVAVNTGYFDQYLDQALIDYPDDLSARIFETLAKRNKSKDLISLFARYCDSGESFYENVEAHFFYSLGFLNPSKSIEKIIQEFIFTYLAGKIKADCRPLAKSSAILYYYWFSENLSDLVELTQQWYFPEQSKEVARALIAVFAANTTEKELNSVLLKFSSHISEDVGRLIQFVSDIQRGTQFNIKSFTNIKNQWPNNRKYYDPRAWLALEILSKAADIRKQHWFLRELEKFKEHAETLPEKRILSRIVARI